MIEEFVMRYVNAAWSILSTHYESIAIACLFPGIPILLLYWFWDKASKA